MIIIIISSTWGIQTWTMVKCG